MPTAALVRRSLLVVVLLLGPTPAGALDVTGKWLLDDGLLPPGTVVDLLQSGSDLSIDLGPSFGVITGNIDQTGIFGAYRGTAQDCLSGLAGTIIGDSRLVGNRATVGLTCSAHFESAAGAERCECDDGNSISGDGCDARCQVEPCFTCTGSPSVCTPSPDGSPCDDRNVCTTGETCSGGVCGGGTPVIPCINLTGPWVETGGLQSSATIAQIGTILEFDGTPTAPARTVGTIDPVTGALMVTAGSGGVLCPILNTLTGTAAADGNSYTLAGTISVEDLSPTPPHFPECVSSSVTITATRATTTTTTLPQLLSGQLLLLTNNTDPTKRKLTIRSRDANLSLGLGVGSVDDPTGFGASVRVRTSAGCNGGPCNNLYSLPPFHWWRPAGGNSGYGYKDTIAAPAGGPFRTGKVKAGRLTLVASGIPFVQDLTADPGPVDVDVTLGSLHMCFTFGGTTRLRPGVSFRATHAPAAIACPP